MKFESDALTVISGAVLAVIVKTCAEDVPPPGEGFVTVTFTDPADKMSETDMVAVSVVELTNVVVFGVPPQLMTEVE